MYLCSSECNFSAMLTSWESTLQSSQRWSTECNFSAMLTSWEASTPRRSRGVLVLPTSQHCRGVCGGSPRATPMKSNFGPVEVQLGFASLDFNLTEIGLQPKSVKSNTYYRWT